VRLFIVDCVLVLSRLQVSEAFMTVDAGLALVLRLVMYINHQLLIIATSQDFKTVAVSAFA
jgi:hypothetical protein